MDRVWTWIFHILQNVSIEAHHIVRHSSWLHNRLVGLVVSRPPRERKVPGSNPTCGGISSGSSHTSDLTIGTPVATLPGAWHYRVSTGAGRPGVSTLWLGEVERLICNFYLSVAARKIVWADPSLRYTIACCWDVKQPTNKQSWLHTVLCGMVWYRSLRVNSVVILTGNSRIFITPGSSWLSLLLTLRQI